MIQAEIECTCASLLNGREQVSFTAVKLEVEKNLGHPVGDGFLANSIERHGWVVDGNIVRRP